MKKQTWMTFCTLWLAACATAPLGHAAGLDDIVAVYSGTGVSTSTTTTNSNANYVNRPYVANGRQYQPLADNQNFNQRGMASWYAAKLEGRLTSSGERYDPNELTAAHPTLPIPSYVRVTHMGSGKSVIVRINDHAPFVDNRVINLSYAAAEQLDMVNAGMAEVEIESVPTPNQPPQMANARDDGASNNRPVMIRFTDRR